MKENTDILMKPEAKLEDRFTNRILTMEGFKEPAGDSILPVATKNAP